MGRRRARANASTASWEMVSVRIALPMDMKNLDKSNEPYAHQHRDVNNISPESCTRTKHELSQCSHHPIWPGAIPHDVN